MAWQPGQGTANRPILFVSEEVWRYWHTRRRQISLEWFPAAPDSSEFGYEVEERFVAGARMREYEVEQLREECRARVRAGESGPFVIPAGLVSSQTV